MCVCVCVYESMRVWEEGRKSTYEPKDKWGIINKYNLKNSYLY